MTTTQELLRAIIELTKLPHTEEALNDALDAYTSAVKMDSHQQMEPYPSALNSIECLIITQRKDCKDSHQSQLFGNLGRSFLLTGCDSQCDENGSVFKLTFTPHTMGVK